MDTSTIARDIASRCAQLGLPSWVIDERGEPLAATWTGSPTVARWMSASSVVAHVREAARPGDRRRGVVEPVPGLRLMGFSCGSSGIEVVALAPGAAILNTELFAQASVEAGVSAAWARGEFDPLIRLNGAGAETLYAAIELWCLDIAARAEQQSTVQSFSRQLSDAFDTIEFLYSLGRSMRDPDRPQEFVRAMCDRLGATMDFGWIAAAFDPATNVPKGLSSEVFVSGSQPVAGGVAVREAIARHRRPDRTGVIEGVEGLSTEGQPQIVIQPVHRAGHAAGAIVAGGKFGRDPEVSSYDTQLLEAAAGFAGSFLETVQLHEDQRALFIGTVRAITAAIDAKDRYTRGHSERVAMLAATLAAKTGAGPVEVERIRIAGLLHDVGKIGVPESVLTKPGRLTEAEFACIRLHPEIGHRILRDIPQLNDVLPGVLHHHERWDGHGYPHGLSGEAIPRVARILALSDTFDAMSSTRSYRPALPRERVMAEIAKCAGAQFDPTLVPAFLAINFDEYDRMVVRHAEQHAVAA